MTLVDQILAVNAAIQHYMREHGKRAIMPDEAAEVVYAAGILVPDQGPPGAPGFTFRQLLRDVSKQYGHDALRQLLGAMQKDNAPGGHYTLLRFDQPSREKVQEILSTCTPESRQQEAQTGTDVLPDYLQDGLDAIFVGTSFGKASSTAGHHYSDPHNKFWDLVNQSELVADFVGAENDHLILDEKCGLTDLAKKTVSSSDANLKSSDFDVDGFIKKIELFKPKVVAFNGKRAYKEVFKKDSGEYGLADEFIGESYVFVLPSSSGADASMTFEQKLVWYKKLKSFLQTL
jgi:double-stranded uracil-DNA glycosylase